MTIGAESGPQMEVPSSEAPTDPLTTNDASTQMTSASTAPGTSRHHRARCGVEMLEETAQRGDGPTTTTGQ